MITMCVNVFQLHTELKLPGYSTKGIQCTLPLCDALNL